MPRKSIFRRNKKKTEETDLERSSFDPNSLNVEEFNTFSNNISNDGTTLDINTEDFAINFDTTKAELPKPEIVKPVLKKSRRKRRKTKNVIKVEELQKILSKLTDIDTQDALDKFNTELSKLSLPKEAEDLIKQTIEKIKAGEEIIDFVLDGSKKISFNITTFVSNITPVVNNLIDEIKAVPEKTDIFAKLKELETARNVIIVPEPVKEQPKPEPKPEPKEDIMAKLKKLETARQKDIKIVIEPQPKSVIKSIPIIKPIKKTEGDNEKIVLNGKTYNIKIKMQPDENDISTLNFYNDDSTDIALHIKINKRKKELSLHEFANGKWSRITRQKLRTNDINFKITIDRQILKIQCSGMFQKNYRRINKNLINMCKWTVKNITIN